MIQAADNDVGNDRKRVKRDLQVRGLVVRWLFRLFLFVSQVLRWKTYSVSKFADDAVAFPLLPYQQVLIRFAFFCFNVF